MNKGPFKGAFCIIKENKMKQFEKMICNVSIWVSTLVISGVNIYASSWNNPGELNDDFFSDYVSAESKLFDEKKALLNLAAIMFPITLSLYLLKLYRHGTDGKKKVAIFGVIISLIVAEAIVLIYIAHPAIIINTLRKVFGK